MKEYDFVIMGGGLGGLFSALAMAKKGYTTALVEKEEHPGGVCSYIHKNGIGFTPSIVYPFNCSKDGTFMTFIDDHEDLEFFESDFLYDLYIESWGKIRIPVEYGEYFKLVKEKFPGEAPGLQKIEKTLGKLFLELEKISDTPEKEINPFTFPVFFKNYRKTYEAFISSHIIDTALKAILSALLFSPDMSLLAMVEFLFNYHNNKRIYPRKGMEGIIELLKRELEKQNVDIMTNSEITEIITAGGRIEGVINQAGKEIKGKNYICAFNFRTLPKVTQKVDEKTEKFFTAYAQYTESQSFFTYAAISRNMKWKKTSACGSYLFRYLPGTDPGKWIQPGGSGMCYIHFLEKNENTTLIRVFYPVYYDDFVRAYNDGGEAYCDELIRVLKKRISLAHPGIEKHIEKETFITPLEYERLWGNDRGASFGWKMNPGQFGLKSVPQKTPLENLYLAGHWAFPGGGIGSVLQSALELSTLFP